MQVEVRNFDDGVELFIPNAKFSQKFQMEVPIEAKVRDVLDRLGISRNIFAGLVNGRRATSETPYNPNDWIDLLQTIKGG